MVVNVPTTYSDQFFIIDPFNGLPDGTIMNVVTYDLVDMNDDLDIEAADGDTVNGNVVTNVWQGDTITVNMGGSLVTITGVTFYVAGGPAIFTPTDGTVLTTATFVSSTGVDTSTMLEVDDLGPPCFVAGTMIQCGAGELAVEEIEVGDLIETMDNGPQVVRWVGSTELVAQDDLAPIRFEIGAVGNSRVLLLSPQHRVLVTGWKAELHFGQSEMLVAAKHLVNGKDVTVQTGGRVEYYHILFDHHEIIESEGAWSESFHPGEQILRQDREIRSELINLFPELDGTVTPTAWDMARSVVKGREASVLQLVA